MPATMFMPQYVKDVTSIGYALVSGHNAIGKISSGVRVIGPRGGLSKCFYQGLRLAVLSADVIRQSKNRRGVA